MTGQEQMASREENTSQEQIAAELRRILARLTTAGATAGLADETPLLRDGLGLDSLRGTLLLTEIQRTFGVDVAAEDLNLDSLASFGALVSYVAARSGAPG